jgi:hypothetical protein
MSTTAELPPEDDGWSVECKVHFARGARGRKRLRAGEAPLPAPVPAGRVPRIARLVALAHRFEDLVREGAVEDYADLARVTGVSRARITQIMNLLHLAPDVQEALLDMPRTLVGRDAVTEGDVRPITATAEWSKQRALWRELLSERRTA